MASRTQPLIEFRGALRPAREGAPGVPWDFSPIMETSSYTVRSRLTPAQYPTTTAKKGTNMKRNWDVVREVLIEVESLNNADFQDVHYDLHSDLSKEEAERAYHGVLLWRSGFIEGIDTSSTDGDGIIATGLTWQGLDLLDTIRSQTVWARIKSISKEKGVELTFDAVKALGAQALAWAIAQP